MRLQRLQVRLITPLGYHHLRQFFGEIDVGGLLRDAVFLDECAWRIRLLKIQPRQARAVLRDGRDRFLVALGVHICYISGRIR